MSLKTYITTLLLFASLIGFSQEVWTLEECVDYAIEHNLQVKNTSFSNESSRESYRQSIRDLLPSVNGSTNYTIRYGRSADPQTNDYVNSDFFSNNYSLNANLDLFRGFQKLNTIRASKFIYKATQEDILQEKFLLAFRVMSAFYDIKFYEGLVANSLEQLEISQGNYDLVEKQVELGLMAGADLYEAESNLLGDKLLLTQNRNLLTNAKLILIQEMNLTEVSDIKLQENLEQASVNENVALDSLYQSARGFVPLVKSQEYRVTAAKKQLQATRGTLFPSLSLVAGYGTSYFETNVDENGNVIPFKTQFNDNSSKFVGAQLNIPISNGWANHSQVKQQKIAHMQAKNNLEIQEQELFKLLQQLVQDNRALIAEYEQSTKKVEAQQLAFTIAQKRYEKGLINALELFQAKNLYGVAQNENLQVGLRLKVNQSTIDFYNGLPIFNIN
ncbi:outer membrane efflux protein [Allomuricauda ruestringensis DSM 13258]|uniref:Outer membrane efflux protein n=1 Tax=Allomuricauda ruestringensis (strain DSM 13258 / CIP 107369 / LMG 19739 / B1) TaxID=886377 RepID=G2PP69_ALLRU|nr:TolC family protein [Allomuricauda ruestringensis]AEM70321.1 outer membrane efflux protein [Allomuricauda ruestringensis DSM 13258]